MSLGWTCVLLTVVFTVYGQLVVKAVVLGAGGFPHSFGDRLHFIARLLLQPWVWSAFAAAFLAAVSWMVAMTELPLSHAYPFTSLALVLVVGLSAVVFQEPIGVARLAGVALIVAGLLLMGRQ